MLERSRLKSKKVSKTESVQSQLDERLDARDIHIGPSDYVPWQQDNKVCFIRMEGHGFGNAPIELELRLSVQDSPNSAGVVIDAIRCAKLALDRGEAGPLTAPSAYYMAFLNACPRGRWHESVDDLLCDKALDFVDICTPPNTHASLIKRALDAGLHVLCEKPLVTRLEDAQVVTAAAAASGRTVHVVHNWLKAAICERISTLVDQGTLGTVRTVRWQTLRREPAVTVTSDGTNWRADPAVAGGGILLDHERPDDGRRRLDDEDWLSGSIGRNIAHSHDETFQGVVVVAVAARRDFNSVESVSRDPALGQRLGERLDRHVFGREETPYLTQRCHQRHHKNAFSFFSFSLGLRRQFG